MRSARRPTSLSARRALATTILITVAPFSSTTRRATDDACRVDRFDGYVAVPPAEAERLVGAAGSSRLLGAVLPQPGVDTPRTVRMHEDVTADRVEAWRSAAPVGVATAVPHGMQLGAVKRGRVVGVLPIG